MDRLACRDVTTSAHECDQPHTRPAQCIHVGHHIGDLAPVHARGLVAVSEVEDHRMLARASKTRSVAWPSHFSGMRPFLKVPLWMRAIMARIDSRPRLGEIAVPTLLIWGEKDGITSRAHHDEILDAISGARLEVAGREMTAQEVIDQALRDRPFYGDEGGLTLTGGKIPAGMYRYCPLTSMATLISGYLQVPPQGQSAASRDGRWL